MRNTIATLCALTLLAFASPALAEDKLASSFKAADYPVEVRKSLSTAVLECRSWENGQVTFAPDAVRKVDFNGDGRIDYIVNLAGTKCSSLLSPYCGTGGCRTEFFVTLPNGKVRRLFSDTIKQYEILRPQVVRFWVHHGACEDGSPERACIKEHRVTDKPFTPDRGQERSE
jgi:hypothetical protein